MNAIIAVVTAIWAVAVTVFWMVCGWRAMRAHEKMAAALESIKKGSVIDDVLKRQA